MKQFLFYFLLFLIYSFIGWIIEVIVIGIEEKKFINRGFMIGPYCPIYGYSSIIMIFYLNHYKDNILTVFLLAIVICTTVEYLISLLMEKLFNARWWDYSNRKFNINGRVCLTNAFGFGLLGVFLVYVANPSFSKLLSKLNPQVMMIISTILLVLFVIDLIISLKISFKIKSTVNKLKKDSTEEFSTKIKAIIESKILNRRILKAFPRFKNNLIKDKVNNFRKEIETKIEERKEKN